MKLIIQIPCFNEEKTLPLVFEKMPKQIPGVDVIEYQIIDDGSTDKTIEVAKSLGVTHIVTYRGKNRRWLGRAFKLGVENALKNGADILVNTDGDNQYPSDKILELIRPILEGKAEVVVGDRRTQSIAEFSFVKKMLQRFGSFMTRILSGGEYLPDAVSGFRAYSKEALAKINVVTEYTYTVDTLMQAYRKGLDVAWVPIQVNPKTRDSRLIKSLFSKVKKSGITILRMYMIYEPFRTFIYISLLFFVPGILLLLRYGYYYFLGDSSGHVQSLVIGGVLVMMGLQMLTLGIIADLIKINRRLVEDMLERVKIDK